MIGCLLLQFEDGLIDANYWVPKSCCVLNFNQDRDPSQVNPQDPQPKDEDRCQEDAEGRKDGSEYLHGDVSYYILFHSMAWFYVIYRYVLSEWRSIRPVEINQYDITIATHYGITMGNDGCLLWNTTGNDVARDIHYDVTMSNDVAMCTYHDITMHNDIAMSLFYYVFSALS